MSAWLPRSLSEYCVGPRAGPGQAHRLRVGLVSERADFFGGGQRSLRDLAVGLGRRSVEPLVILPEAGPLAADLEAQGVAWVALPLPSARLANLAGVARSILCLTDLARARRLDLLHSDSPRTALYAGLAARLLRKRHVWHVRASRASSPFLDRLLLALSDAAVAVSAAAAARTEPFRHSRKVRVVPTGLPPIAFLDREAARASLALPREPFIAGVIGRVETDKGADVALAALPTLRRLVPGSLLAFLGSKGQAGPGAACLQDAAEACRAGTALVLGERPEAAPLLRAFDVVLHPARHEALPRVLIEALFAGVPVVASHVGGIPEIIESGVSGLLVPADDPIALGTAAAALARDPALRLRLAASGRERASALFSIDAMLRDILTLYAALVHGARRPALAAREVVR